MNFDEDTLRRAVKDLVHKATEEKTLEQVKKKTVLRYLGECGKFEPDVLGDENFKEKAVAIATPLLQAALDQQEEDADPDIVQKSRAKKRKTQPDDPDEKMKDERPTKKARPAVSKKKKEKAEGEDVSMSDAEAAEPPWKEATSESKPTSTADDKKQEPASPPKTPVNKEVDKKPEKPRKKKADSDEESEDGKRPSTPPVLKNGSTAQDKSAPNGEETLAEAAELSDGDLSVLDPDSPKKEKPKPSRKKSDSKAPKSKKERKATTSKGKETDPDEEEIKRLKNYVVACGVRKQWKKEFEGVEDKPKKQIARLKEILAGLGMKGRLSLDKAKAIRRKRELATELEEVVAFAAKRGARTEEKPEKRSRKVAKSEDELRLSEEEQEAAESRPRTKRNLLAFLDDQSDNGE